jgi:hypothetical protein
MLISSCKKEQDEITTTLQGRVLTRGTSTKASNQRLELRLYNRMSNSWFAQPSEIVATIYTDTNGYFNHRFTADAKFKEHHLWLISDVPDHDDKNPITFKLGGIRELNIELTPIAWVKLKVKNLNPQVNNKITISIGLSVDPIVLWGPVNTEILVQTYGNSPVVNLYTVHRNEGYIQFKDTLYIPAFDTILHEVNY